MPVSTLIRLDGELGGLDLEPSAIPIALELLQHFAGKGVNRDIDFPKPGSASLSCADQPVAYHLSLLAIFLALGNRCHDANFRPVGLRYGDPIPDLEHRHGACLCGRKPPRPL